MHGSSIIICKEQVVKNIVLTTVIINMYTKKRIFEILDDSKIDILF